MTGAGPDEFSAIPAAVCNEVKAGDVWGKRAIQLLVGRALIVHVLDDHATAFEQVMVEVIPRAMSRDIGFCS